jgi:hypothetical protein
MKSRYLLSTALPFLLVSSLYASASSPSVQASDEVYLELTYLQERFRCTFDRDMSTNTTVSREVFAKNLNSCIQEIDKIASIRGQIDNESLTKINHLQETFAKELAELNNQ